MSLPTPPSTSRRNKENHPATSSRVGWSPDMVQLRRITGSPPPQCFSAASASKKHPMKSILKPPRELLPFPEEYLRQTTPEPTNPLSNLTYLDYPVSRIISSDATLRDLIEAYSVLAARIRSSVTPSTPDVSTPLFHPLRKHRDAIVDALVRDLGRALEDPGCSEMEVDELCERERLSLPSPQNSPKRKKGMSAEQVKFARDLCTTSHSVMRLLCVIFTMPAVYRVFTDAQLRTILTAVLAIPLASELPTPNARKTYALSIWLIQAQRLPSDVLFPAIDRIAYALRRGIEGELGKEGKKGSASDGLKAVHDLAIYQPSTFITPFTDLLPSILSNLLAPTLTLRTQACHALGGFVLGCTSLPLSNIHSRISNTIAEFLTAPSKPTGKTTSASSQNAIVRTLRTTLLATDPQAAAQGPVWALSVLASFIVLLGPAMYLDVKVTRIISALLSCSMNHKKSSIRALGCIVWRTVTWAYFQPPHSSEDEGEDRMELDQVTIDEGRANYWKIVKSVVDLGAGVATIAGLLGKEVAEEDDLQQAMTLLKTMISRGGVTCGDAMDIVKHFVTSDSSPPEPWDLGKLLPQSLFSASPGLLTVDYKSLVGAVKPIFDQCPQLDDVRSLTHDEVTTPWVFEQLVKLWRDGIEQLEIPEDFEAPTEITGIWQGLLKANVTVLEDAQDDDGISQFAVRAIRILIDILQDENLNLTTKPLAGVTLTDANHAVSTSCNPPTRSNAALKLSLIRELWSVTKATIANSLVCLAGETFLEWLMINENRLVWESDSEDDARRQWASLCADILVVCDIDEMSGFWGTKVGISGKKKNWGWSADIRRLVWRCFVDVWREENDATIEGCVVLLGIPFADKIIWDLNNSDFDIWNTFLHHTTTKAQAFGIDSANVLDEAADTISRYHTPAFVSSVRVVDLLLSHLDISDARQVPNNLFNLVDDAFVATYPPEPRNKVASVWLIRTITRIVDSCPSSLGLDLLESIQDGLSTWISDDYHVFDEEEYACDILPLYQTILLTMQEFPMDYEVLDRLSGILVSPFGQASRHNDVSEAFQEFWQSSCRSLKEPKSGWPAQIQKCLHWISGGDANDVSHTTTSNMDTSAATPVIDDVEDLRWPESEDDDDSPTDSSTGQKAKRTSQHLPGSPFDGFGSVTARDTSVTVVDDETIQDPILSLLSAAFQLSIPSKPPSTPPKALGDSASTPHRPRKLANAPSIRLLPQSPLSSSYCTPMPNHGLSLTRSKTNNKENESPCPKVPSVTDRIAMGSPRWIKPSPSKRQMSGGNEEGAPKRQKTDSGFVIRPVASPSSDISEDERIVEAALVEGGQSEINQSAKTADVLSMPLVQSTATFSQKRKSVFMEAVELPTLREVNRRFKERAASNFASVSKNNSHVARKSTTEDDLIRRKKRCLNNELPGIPSGDPFLSTSLKRFQALKVAGSDDSIMCSATTQSDGSSDDDPHLGQVTPHRIISPALRRAKTHKNDPPSDDSNLSDSPTRHVVARRLQRLESISSVSGPFVAGRI